MSVESIAWALNVTEPTLAPASKLVLIGIANHDGDGGAWPSMTTLARYAGVSTRHARRIVADLVAVGLVEVEYQAGGNAGTRADRRPNLFHLPLSTGALRGGTCVSPRDGDGRTPMSEREDTHVRNGRTPMSSEPSLNHPETSSARVLAEIVAAHEVDAAISRGQKIGNREAVIRTAIQRIWTKDRARLDWAAERNSEYFSVIGRSLPTTLLIDYVSTGNSRGFAPLLAEMEARKSDG